MTREGEEEGEVGGLEGTVQETKGGGTEGSKETARLSDSGADFAFHDMNLNSVA